MADFDPFKPLTIDDLGGSNQGEEQIDLPEEDIDVGPDMGDEEALGDEEVDPIGDAAVDDAAGIGPSDLPNEGDAGIKLDDQSADVPGTMPAPAPAPAAPQVKWTNVPQDNGDIWSDHIDGYTLRARALSAKNGTKTKYIAQLFKDRKLLEKGVVFIDQTADAQAVLQNISDRILDKMGLVSHSLVPPEPPAQPAAPPEDDGGVQEDDIPADDGAEGGDEALDDLGLGEEDIEALGG